MLDKILADCRNTIEDARKKLPRSELEQLCEGLPPVRSLSKALSPARINLIAEIKGASPSRGGIRASIDPAAIGALYEASGAAAISVLTEPIYFNGKIEYLRLVRERVTIPILRKDFIFTDYQLYEARAKGADAVLLMTSVISDDSLLNSLIESAHGLGLETLLEVSDINNLKRAFKSKTDVLGINNRNFKTLETDINTSLKLIKNYHGYRPIISESGIFTRADVAKLKAAGFNGILVGTALMKSNDIKVKIEELIGSD